MADIFTAVGQGAASTLQAQMANAQAPYVQDMAAMEAMQSLQKTQLQAQQIDAAKLNNLINQTNFDSSMEAKKKLQALWQSEGFKNKPFDEQMEAAAKLQMEMGDVKGASESFEKAAKGKKEAAEARIKELEANRAALADAGRAISKVANDDQWNRLMNASDPKMQEKMAKIADPAVTRNPETGEWNWSLPLDQRKRNLTDSFNAPKEVLSGDLKRAEQARKEASDINKAQLAILKLQQASLTRDQKESSAASKLAREMYGAANKRLHDISLEIKDLGKEEAALPEKPGKAAYVLNWDSAKEYENKKMAIQEKRKGLEKERKDTLEIATRAYESLPDDIRKLAPKPTASPALFKSDTPSSEIAIAAQTAWGAYEPDKYDYRMKDGKLQRKEK